MTAHALLKRAADSGVELYLDGEKLRARGCRQAMETLSPELRIHKAEIVELLASDRMTDANEPASAEPHGLENLIKPAIAPAANDPAPEPPTDPNAWRELAAAYHLHHFACPVCIAAGRGAGYGLRCGVGAALWTSYENT